MQNYPDEYKDMVDNSRFTQYLEDIRMVMISKMIGYYKPKTILDVGCGIRPVLWYCDLSSCIHYACVEPNPPKELNVPNLYDCKLEDIKPIQHITYDMIILSSILHIVEDVDIFLTKVKEFCHQDTIIYINTPNSISIHRILGFYLGLLKDLNELSENDVKFNHKRTFNIKTLEETASKYFKVLDKGSYLFKPFADAQMNLILKDNENILLGLTKICEHFKNLGCEIWIEAKA